MGCRGANRGGVQEENERYFLYYCSNIEVFRATLTMLVALLLRWKAFRSRAGDTFGPCTAELFCV